MGWTDAKTKGTVGLTDLYKALVFEELFTSRGKKEGTKVPSSQYYLHLTQVVHEWITGNSKGNARKGQAYELRYPTRPFKQSFLYLNSQAIDSSPEQILQARKELFQRFGKCIIPASDTHSQLRLPVGENVKSKNPSGDRGLVHVQVYVLRAILHLAESQYQSNVIAALTSILEKMRLQFISNKTDHLVFAHRCKSACESVGHGDFFPHSFNHSNEFCTSFWVVKGKLINHCRCHTDPQHQCIYPGGQVSEQTILAEKSIIQQYVVALLNQPTL